jgi:hypothetical protein
MVMILAALIALFAAVTVGLVIVQRRPRADRRRRRRRRICRLAKRSPIVDRAEGRRKLRGAAVKQSAPARESAGA